MEKYRRFKIYENNINNNPSNTNSSVQNKNQIKNTNLDGKSSVYFRKYKYSNINHSKKIQKEYNEAKNKDDIQSQNKIIDKFTINNNKSNHNTINNNPKENNFNKKFIYNFGNNLTNKENDKKLLMNSFQKNNIFKPKNDINKERQERQQLSTNLNRYSIKYNNNSNKLNKSIEKKNIDKNINNTLKNNPNKDLLINNSYSKKNSINIKKPSTQIDDNKINDINQINAPNNKQIRTITSNEKYTNYFRLSNKYHPFPNNKDQSNLKLPETGIKESKIEKGKEKLNEIELPENFLCTKCQESAEIKLNSDSLTININCKNGHNIKNIPINDFIKKNDTLKNEYISCFSCKRNFDKKLLFYCSCGLIICKNCIRNKLHNTHNQIPFIQKNYFCPLHKKTFVSFCKMCNKNICIDCIKEHKKHENNIIYFRNIIPKDRDVRIYKNELEKIKMSKEKFNKDLDQFLEIFKEKRNEFNKKVDNYIKVQSDIIDKINNKEILNYESICNVNNLNFEKNNLFDNYLKIGNNFNKKGKIIINLLSPEDNEKPKYEMQKKIKNFEIIGNKNIDKKYEISKEIDINLINEDIHEGKNNFNIICPNINNLFINNSMGVGHKNKINNEQVQKSNESLDKTKKINNDKKNKDDLIKESLKVNGNKLEAEKSKEIIRKIPKKFEVIQKIENCNKMLEKKDDRCITSFTLLKNNRIVITFKGGIIKFYEFTKINDEILLIELIRLEEDEYCFNYAIELQDRNVAACSEDGTVKIIKLFFDEKRENIDEKVKIIQIINEMNNDPIYTIKELENQNLVLGCWKNILVYQKASEYELINKIKINEYTFSILEISPNEIIASHSESKTLTGHNFRNYKFYSIKDIESNENCNILCKYNNQRDIIFVAFDKGINIVSIVKKILIKKIILNEIISSLCPIEMKVDLGGENKTIWGLMLGAKRKIFGEKVNYAYSMLQIGFNLNEKDEGILTDDGKKDIEYKIISRKDRIHYYDITNLQNSLWEKNKDSLKILENKDEQWIFSSGNEDKLIKIWKFK